MEKGTKFFTSNDNQRIALENKYEQMYSGLYSHIINYSADERGLNARKVAPLVPLPAVIADINADLLFGEFPNFIFDDEGTQGVIDQWLSDTYFKTDTLEACTYTSVLGTIFLYSYEYDSKTYYKYIKPNSILWDEDDFGFTNAKVFDLINIEDNGKYANYKVQEHKFVYDEEAPSPYLTDGRKHVLLNYNVRIRISDGLVKDISEYKETITEQDFLPIVKVCNIKLMGQKSGKSDYEGKCQLFAEVDNRLDQINYILQEHVEPWTAVPAGLLDQDGKLSRNFGKMYEKMGTTANDDISVRTWDGKLTDAFESISTMIRMILFTSRISAPIAGFNDKNGTSVESGVALKWRSISTSAMIMRKRKYWEDSLRDFLTQQSQMSGVLKDIDFSLMKFEWQDGMPMDEETFVNNVVTQVNAGLMSKLEGIQQTQELDKANAEKELNQIGAEQQENANIQATKFRVEV